jgi:hypothetical protein
MIKLNIRPNRVPPQLWWAISALMPLRHRWFIAGGAIRSVIDKTEVADIDLFQRPTTNLEGEPIDTENVDDVHHQLLQHGCRKVFTCPNGKLHTWKHRSGLKIQVINEIIGTPEEVIDSFDLTASRLCCFEGEFYAADKKAFTTAARKQIEFHNVLFPNATIRRIFKYMTKGYQMSPESAFDFIVKSAVHTDKFDENIWRKYID